MSLRISINNYFGIARLGSTARTECVAGVTTYLSLSYIFIVNPAILSQSGINPSAVLFATVVASALATISMGLWANLPFAVAPGLEMNGFFAFVVCAPAAMGLTWQEGLGSVFLSGLLGVLFTAIGIRSRVLDSIPDGLKTAIGSSIGIFVAAIGLSLSGVITFNNGVIDFGALTVSRIFTPQSIVMFASFVLVLLLSSKRVRLPGAILLTIVISAAVCDALSIGEANSTKLGREMTSAIGELKLAIASPSFWSATIIFFVIDFVGGIGKIVGLTAGTAIHDDNGNVTNLSSGLYIDGISTAAGAFLGTSSLIPFVESTVGIRAGGRTGLTAVVCGVLMAGSIVVAPVLRWVPAQAVAGVLLYVGYLLRPRRTMSLASRNKSNIDLAIAAIMAALTFITFSLDKPLAFGLLMYGLIDARSASAERGRGALLIALSLIIVATMIAQKMVVPAH